MRNGTSFVENEEILAEFLVETTEHLDEVDRDLLSLERDPFDRQALCRIFRAVHTIKGTCSFFGFGQLEALAHGAESLLSRLRDGEIRLDAEITGTLLAVSDAIREILVSIEREGTEGPGDYRLLRDALQRLSGEETSAGQDDPGTAEPPRFGELLVQTGRVKPEALAEALEAQQKGDGRFLGEILVEAGALQPSDIEHALRLQEESRSSNLWDTTIRVDVRVIDRLIELAGELASTRSQLHPWATASEDTGLLAVSARLNRITTELQEALLKTRLQPIGSLWSRLPRLVRDLAVTSRKRIRVEMDGQEILVGRAVLEALKDPVLHLVRNGVDHGVELPEERLRRGKPPEGRILLQARVENDQLHVAVSDDGAGLSAERIRERAIRRGWIAPAQAARMEEQELFQLIFLPGFSTAERITSISGRGVGLDVVKSKIEALGGAIEIASQPMQGTTFVLKVPLTLTGLTGSPRSAG